MTNPFDGRRVAPEAVNYGFRDMVPGETRTVQIATQSKEPPKLTPSDPASMMPKTITRTERPFMVDWVDSTNEELAARRVPYLRWVFVDGYEMPPRLVDTRYVRGRA